jgi:hypothetical protein
MELRQDNWVTNAAELDMCICFILSKAENYLKFVGLVIVMAKNNIPRGYCKRYIPRWSEESQHVNEEFKNLRDPKFADHLMKSLNVSRMGRWTSAIEHVNFLRFSREAWGLLGKLGECNRNVVGNTSINPNQIANRIVEISRVPSNKDHTKTIKKSLRDLKYFIPPPPLNLVDR